MEYEARIALEDGTVLKSYHTTRRMAEEWIGKISSLFESQAGPPEHISSKSGTSRGKSSEHLGFKKATL